MTSDDIAIQFTPEAAQALLSGRAELVLHPDDLAELRRHAGGSLGIRTRECAMLRRGQMFVLRVEAQ